MTKEEFVTSIKDLPEDRQTVLLQEFELRDAEIQRLSEDNKNPEHLKNLIKERDEAKKKAKDFQDKLNSIETKSLEDERKYKELYQQHKARAEELQPKIESLSEEVQKLMQEKEAVETARRTELLARLPEGSDEKKFGETIKDLNQLSQYISLEEKRLKAGFTPDGGRNGKGLNLEGKKWRDLTMAEKSELKKVNPAKYEELFYKRNEG